MTTVSPFIVLLVLVLLSGAGSYGLAVRRVSAKRTTREIDRLRIELDRRIDRIGVQPAPVALPFEAWSTCPGCGHFDAHWIHVPVEIPADATVRDSAPYRIRDDGTEFHVFGGRQPDLNKWNVIRECRSCGQEWGQL